MPITQVRLAPDGDEGVWLAWEDYGGDEAGIRLARAARGTVNEVAGGLRAGRLPELAATDGGVTMAWLADEAVRVLEGRSPSPEKRRRGGSCG